VTEIFSLCLQESDNIFKDTSSAAYVASSGSIIASNKLKTAQKEQLSRVTDENHENLQSGWSISEMRFVPAISQLRGATTLKNNKMLYVVP
jgi:hypothetical protein